MKATLSAALLLLFVSTATSGTTSKKIDQHFKVEPGQKIEVRGFSGSRVQFKSWDKPEVHVRLNVRVSGLDAKNEKSALDGIKLEEYRSADLISITFDDANKTTERSESFWSGLLSLVGLTRTVSREVDGEVFVPAANDLSAHIPYATVSLENMKGRLNFSGTSNDLTLRNCSALQSVANDYGKTSIHTSGGSLVLRGQSGTITVEDFDGDIRCASPYAKLRFARIKKPLSIESQSGDVGIDDVQGNVIVNSDFSPITVSNVAGFVDIRSQSGTIRVRHVGGVHVDADYSTIEIADVSGISGKEVAVNSQSGSVTVNNVTGNVRIDNPYSRMRLTAIKGNVRLTTQSGSIDAENISGDWDSDTQYSAVRVNRLSAAQIRATNSGDVITFALTTTPSLIEIRNEYAGVSLTIPKGFGGDVSLDAEYGSIETDLPLTTKNRGGSGYAFGKIGSGNGSIKIETTSGNISLQEK